ncbi:hypothetical protein [Fulvivirga ligni]|uniref:hypothetical protein n=1 Tax=Fulvivirga ligni TaxID=2904246 RepID=UPI001F4385AA|nr:hypothetical protein [Fulvivirga ligni]UII22273.1 hypothetical protein LVD16_03385 [Fulvivirga ligni]
MKKLALKILLSAVVAIGTFTSIHAYPISPGPLRKLVQDADYIIYADVVDIVNIPKNGHDRYAVLSIKELLQGKLKDSVIQVMFSPNMICPAPARYEIGTTVLAFLDKTENDEYITHALSYGAKTLDEQGFEIYKQRIVELQEINSIKNDEKRAEATLDWLVKCASNRVTRWEGTYELSPESDFMSFYDRDSKTHVMKNELSESQIQTLRDALFNSKTNEYEDLGLIDLVANDGGEEMLTLLTRHLKDMDVEKIWYKEFLLTRIATLSNRDDLIAIAKKLKEIDHLDKERKDKENAIMKEFIAVL